MTSRLSVTIGLLYRRDFRRMLNSRGLTYTEDKGLLDSHFVITGPSDTLRYIAQLLRSLDNEEND